MKRMLGLLFVFSFGMQAWAANSCANLLKINSKVEVITQCETNLNGRKIIMPKVDLCLYKINDKSQVFYGISGMMSQKQSSGSERNVNLGFVLYKAGKNQILTDYTEAYETSNDIHLHYNSLNIELNSLFVYGTRKFEFSFDKVQKTATLLYQNDFWLFPDELYEADLSCR